MLDSKGRYTVMKLQQYVTTVELNNSSEDSALLEIHALFERDEINQTKVGDQLISLRKKAQEE